jgi:hypothetical protein
VQGLGRAREAELVGDGDEVPEIAEVRVDSKRLSQEVLDRVARS